MSLIAAPKAATQARQEFDAALAYVMMLL